MACPVPIPAIASLSYTALFCEENIYLLGQALIEAGFSADTMQVLFLSNRHKQIPLLCQKTQADNADYVMWDYHVILQLHYADQDWILDFDSKLDFPLLKQQYLQQTIIPHHTVKPEFQVYCRQIPMTDYLRQFSSTRAHMRDEDGHALTEFPTYPPILASDRDEAVDLMTYIDMQESLQNTTLHIL